jgi:hypothetical protein
MPELGTYGSVRGALSNERPYRDSGAPVFCNSRAIHTAFTRHDSPPSLLTRFETLCANPKALPHKEPSGTEGHNRHERDYNPTLQSFERSAQTKIYYTWPPSSSLWKSWHATSWAGASNFPLLDAKQRKLCRSNSLTGSLG